MRQLITSDEQLEPAEQLALDEALLNCADADDVPATVRTWRFQQSVVVLGRSSKIAVETDQRFCRQHGVPILRRCSGGAAVVGGPGCLMYSVVVPQVAGGGISGVDAAHDYAITRVLAAVRKQLPTAKRQGICDLTLDDQKFSGNSLRITRRHVLYHGTILIDSDLEFLDQCLAAAPRQPEYRRGRQHRDFITNADVEIDTFARDLASQFHAGDAPPLLFPCVPDTLTKEVRRLLDSRYEQVAWHQRH